MDKESLKKKYGTIRITNQRIRYRRNGGIV